jgi:hypothetical protein
MLLAQHLLFHLVQDLKCFDYCLEPFHCSVKLYSQQGTKPLLDKLIYLIEGLSSFFNQKLWDFVLIYV